MNIFSIFFIKCIVCEKKKFITNTTIVTWSGECDYQDVRYPICPIKFNACNKCAATECSTATANKIKAIHNEDYHIQVSLV